MLCTICGKPITGNISKDHVYPRTLWKWQEEYLDPEEFRKLKSAVESAHNVVKTHHECNITKQDTIMSHEQLFLSDKQRERLDDVFSRVEPFIQGYVDRKNKIVEKQKNKCYRCGRKLQDTKILRRINAKKPRTEENGCVICAACNQEPPFCSKS